MWHVEILNTEKSVLGLTWQGLVKPEEIVAVNQKVSELHKEFGQTGRSTLTKWTYFSNDDQPLRHGLERGL